MGFCLRSKLVSLLPLLVFLVLLAMPLMHTLEEVDTKTKKFRASSYSTEEYASTIKSYGQPLSDKLLPDLPPHLGNKIITLVVDLNEMLVHSDWKRERGWRTFKRPGVDDFLEQLEQHYEIVVYTDTLQMYVDPVLERLDKKECIAHRLSRAATLYKDGKHYRDLSKLNRDPSRVIYVSGHALEQCLQLEHCVEIKPWTTDDVNDTTLLDLIPFLEFVALSRPPDIRKVLTSYPRQDIVKEFKERSNKKQGGMEQQEGRSFW